ncbi:Cytochrome b5-like Heme/Steroid binding domain protein [Candidatus Bilamarchaeum dharawalense]|uniref:Cytochrome b5-like Heme/Steroid binding domain protein n=1 Tax=Candidatus Bilamarchaeum dharawalense TaxID=2885759 RepID=A0A5E4LWW2_9ARCH|nr:Cytochrome b5-like Heme/Steroid binding domain protein [Candidatus Bilamarchaeum dharawalense]
MRYVILLALALLLLGCTMNPQDLKPASNQNGNGQITQPTGNTSSDLGVLNLTMAEVTKHNTATDCWMVINGKVLNLSSFVTHPGGNAYVPFCGTDATVAFNTKGGTGVPHSENAASQMVQFIIGELNNVIEQPPKQNNTPADIPPILNDTPPIIPTTPQITLTMEEVAKHNKADDCWIVINGNVLNLTSFSSHPGGGTYLPYCGTEATEAFNTKGGQGNSHSATANAWMDNFIIGQLGQNITNTISPINNTIPTGLREYEEEEYEDD